MDIYIDILIYRYTVYIYIYIYKCIAKNNFKFFFNPKEERTVLLRSFFCNICHFCMTYETKKNTKNSTFFIKNVKERKEHRILL